MLDLGFAELARPSSERYFGCTPEIMKNQRKAVGLPHSGVPDRLFYFSLKKSSRCSDVTMKHSLPHSSEAGTRHGLPSQ